MAATRALIIFDCDGTLADSHHFLTEATRFAFVSAGLAAPERGAILRCTRGVSMADAIACLAPDECASSRNDLMRSFSERNTDLRQKARGRDPMFHGAAALLRSLAAREDAVLALATGKCRISALAFIQDHGLDGVFATIQTADEAPSKPHPAMLYQAMEETGVPPEAAIMVGDTSYDMVMAASANIASIGVTWGYHTPVQLQRAGAKMMAGSFAALAQLLDPQLLSVRRNEHFA
jgi:phosphoglycolate phosphatase